MSALHARWVHEVLTRSEDPGYTHVQVKAKIGSAKFPPYTPNPATRLKVTGSGAEGGVQWFNGCDRGPESPECEGVVQSELGMLRCWKFIIR